MRQVNMKAVVLSQEECSALIRKPSYYSLNYRWEIALLVSIMEIDPTG